jgi:hypothetical protein
MKKITTGLYPAGRLEAGAAILMAAEAADVTMVEKRLAAFARSHQAYAQLHAAVEAAEAHLQAHTAVTFGLDAEQDAAVENLAAALVGDHQPRTNPFGGLAGTTPSAVKALNYGEKAKLIRSLAEVIRNRPTLSNTTREVAQSADQVASSMQQELLAMEKAQAALESAREAREAAGKTWDTALAALKHDARAAAAEGVPVLGKALFGRTRAKKKTPESAVPEQPVVTTAAPQQAVTSAAPDAAATMPATTPTPSAAG